LLYKSFYGGETGLTGSSKDMSCVRWDTTVIGSN